ncbi:nitroreductase family protein [Dactylosporangium sp. CA-139066]|uniref:nitroreductase family protein n=1 Tax=Dactylosporangium sp. CA-139066 TaxID=3239930 RepID=UPI003D8EB5F3
MTGGAQRWSSDTPLPITDFETVLTTTRAVRRRLDLDRPVPRGEVLDCLRLALQAPTGADAEDWRFILIGDPGVKLAVGDEYRRAFDREVRPRLPGLLAGAGPADAAGAGPEAAERRRKARVYGGAEYLADNIHRVPWLVLACATRPYPGPHMAPSVFGSVFPAVWSFQLALRSRGLGSLITTLHLRRPEGLAALLGIPAGVTQCALLPVAYTLGTDFRPAARRPVADVVFADVWGRPLDGTGEEDDR